MHEVNFFEYIVNKNRINLSEQAIYLSKKMDGKTADEELKEEFKNRFQLTLSNKNFRNFLNRLSVENLLIGKNNGYLISKLSPLYCKKLRDKYEKEKIKEANYAGICYKDKPEDLFTDLRRCFSLVNTSELRSLCKGRNSIKGIIVPHSNIELSGQCAAWAYKAIAENSLPDLFIVMGIDHSGLMKNPNSVLMKDFRTPLGVINVDKDFGRMLARNCDFNIFNDSDVFLTEHSIELQLPFLQYISSQVKTNIRILPMLCKRRMWKSEESADEQERFINALKKTIKESKKKTIVIASGDLVHEPLWEPSPIFHKKNREMINLLKTGKAYAFKKGMSSKETYASCGKLQFYTLLRLLEPSNGILLNYSWTSNSKLIDKNRARFMYENLVNIGYASMVFY
jgi:hypothetical protein